MTLGSEKEGEAVTVVDLPEVVLVQILTLLDTPTLARLRQVCKFLNRFVNQDGVWRKHYSQQTLCNSNEFGRPNSSSSKRFQGKCRVCWNWKRGYFNETRLTSTSRQMPWMLTDEDQMFLSNNNVINCYKFTKKGTLQQLTNRTLKGHTEDVSKFVCKDDMIISGCVGGCICGFSRRTSARLFKVTTSHTSYITDVDLYNNTVISGSQDSTVKLWSIVDNTLEAKSTIYVHDRVWSVAINPNGSLFVTGTAGLNCVPALRLWDINRGSLVHCLDDVPRNGAGILDIQFESPNTLLSCGYDTFIRMWDVRIKACVRKWEEPFDVTVYCMKRFGENAIFSGTARYGMARLWDKRSSKPIQMYYPKRSSSPVYSMACTSSYLYLALDRGIHMLDFAVH